MNDSKKPYDPLSDALNIDSEIEIIPPGSSPAGTPYSEDRISDLADADYDFARRSVTGAIQNAEDALSMVLGVAKASQAPRAYEVVATMIKVILDGNKDLLDLSKRTMEIKSMSVQEEGPTTINNNLIVTTDQLQKILKDQGVVTTTREKKDGTVQEE